MQIGTQVSPWTTETVVIDYAHEEIHEGNHYFYTDCVELGTAANLTNIKLNWYEH